MWSSLLSYHCSILSSEEVKFSAAYDDNATQDHVKCNVVYMSYRSIFQHLMLPTNPPLGLYGFMVKGNVDDVNVLNEVRKKVRSQGRVWWALEASKGADWYLQPDILLIGAGGIMLKTSLKISALSSAITLKSLIRKGYLLG
ncbi:hypothetical protein Bca101_068425 [Brassica carinata]